MRNYNNFMQPQRVSTESIVAAYRATGSVWKAAKQLGVVGQSVWERLKAIDYPLGHRRWTKEEIEELARLADTCTLADISQRLGRPYAAVACMISRKGFSKNFGNRGPKKLPRGSGLTAPVVKLHAKTLDNFSGSLRQFCNMNGLSIELLVRAFQKYEPEFWKHFSMSRNMLPKICPYCSAEFWPMSALQKTCSRKCTADQKRDADYFGGKRRSAIGLAEGICQLCQQPKTHLSAHHFLGKEHDPDNQGLIALCRGCHQIVTLLGGRKFADSAESWQMLISLVFLRRVTEHHPEYAGAEVTVEIELLTREQVEEELEESGE